MEDYKNILPKGTIYLEVTVNAGLLPLFSITSTIHWQKKGITLFQILPPALWMKEYSHRIIFIILITICKVKS